MLAVVAASAPDLPGLCSGVFQVILIQPLIGTPIIHLIMQHIPTVRKGFLLRNTYQFQSFEARRIEAQCCECSGLLAKKHSQFNLRTLCGWSVWTETSAASLRADTLQTAPAAVGWPDVVR